MSTMTIADIQRVLRELLGSYFAEHALPMPEIVLTNKLGSRYLAQCAWRAGSPNTVITVHRSILGDPKTLRRVLAHELIHHWQFLRTDQTRALSLARHRIKQDGHGADFQDYADRINASAGADYVTKESDQSYDRSSSPSYYILIQPHGTERYGFTIALRPSKGQKEEIERRRTKDAARLFQITDGQFLNGAQIKRLGGYSLPKTPEQNVVLRTLYLTGREHSS